MLKINKKLQYGLDALLFLSSAGAKAVSTREISERCEAPEAMLSKILQSLKASGLVQAVHGNRGGYRLARPLPEIALSELVTAIEERRRPRRLPSTASAPLKKLGEKLGKFLETTSLESLRETSAGAQP
jgi:Rrf2 family protein